MPHDKLSGLADIARWFLDQWISSLSAAIEAMTEERPEISWSVDAPVVAGEAQQQSAGAAAGEQGAGAAAGEQSAGAAAEEQSAGAAPIAQQSMLWWEQSFSFLPFPALWIGAAPKTCDDLGRRALAAAGIENAESADAQNTYFEILSQSLGALVQPLGSRLSNEVSCERGGERKRAASLEHVYHIAIRYPDGALSLIISLSPELLAGLDPDEAQTAAGKLHLPSSAEAPSATALMGLRPASAGTSQTMDLLLDVELPVSVSFGRTQLPVKEVLKLTTGSIVELGRSVNEPVDVVVNNCIIARGEVVVVDGNYGIRIDQIISRQDRLRSLR
jgi:flagellar motor switch protein FliN/FliY